MRAREQLPAKPGGIFESRGPLVMLWQADPLLASLLLRFARTRVEVREIEQVADWRNQGAGREVVLLVGASPLREPDDLRFIHRLGRSERVLVIGVGRLDAHEALVAGELGVATIVSTLHDARCAAHALRAHFEIERK